MDKKALAQKLNDMSGSLCMFADGFIDEQWSLVGKRASYDDVTLIEKMTAFADRIKAVGTGGMGIELIKKRMAFGGFTANIGFAAARLGIDTTMTGIFGEGQVSPVFAQVQEVCKMITLGASSITHALEFDDGKILMTDMESVLGVRWSKIVDAVGMDELTRLLTESDIIGVGYWSLMPAFDEIVENICDILRDDSKNRRFFFDFADISKRDEASLVRTLNLLKDNNGKIPMTLSVNEHEGSSIFKLYGENFCDAGIRMDEITEKVRSKLGLDELVVHTPHFASAANKDATPAIVPQTYVEKPVRTAGAGDTFNGGYIAGLLSAMPTDERLHTANSAVTYFLKNGIPPSKDELTKVFEQT